MDYLDLTLTHSEQNVAFDLVLLDECERIGREVLRVWEAVSPCVVAGYANRSVMDVNLEACHRLGIPVLRRHSGGGTVTLGPGCLNYAVVLNAEIRESVSGIRSTNLYVMNRLRRAVARLTGRNVKVAGFTDLAIGDRKFSGNAQYRRRKGILFHGTIMCSLDIRLIEVTLGMPPSAPEYRRGRSHSEFLTNICESLDNVKQALCQEWRATPLAEYECRALRGRIGPLSSLPRVHPSS